MTGRILSFTSALALATAAQAQDVAFNRVASFATPANMAEAVDTSRETSAEIISATAAGMTLVYNNTPLGVLGLIDLSDPRNPQPLGAIELDGNLGHRRRQDRVRQHLRQLHRSVRPSRRVRHRQPRGTRALRPRRPARQRRSGARRELPRRRLGSDLSVIDKEMARDLIPTSPRSTAT